MKAFDIPIDKWHVYAHEKACLLLKLKEEKKHVKKILWRIDSLLWNCILLLNPETDLQICIYVYASVCIYVYASVSLLD